MSGDGFASSSQDNLTTIFFASSSRSNAFLSTKILVSVSNIVLANVGSMNAPLSLTFVPSSFMTSPDRLPSIRHFSSLSGEADRIFFKEERVDDKKDLPEARQDALGVECRVLPKFSSQGLALSSLASLLRRRDAKVGDINRFIEVNRVGEDFGPLRGETICRLAGFFAICLGTLRVLGVIDLRKESEAR
jgi:hypothetical protein